VQVSGYLYAHMTSTPLDDLHDWPHNKVVQLQKLCRWPIQKLKLQLKVASAKKTLQAFGYQKSKSKKDTYQTNFLKNTYI
jgi:hypothetical protein